MIECMDNPPDLFQQNTVQARKVHRCCECGENIFKGDRYVRTVGVWDGKLETYKTCVDCDSLRDEMATTDSDGVSYCVGYTNLIYDLSELELETVKRLTDKHPSIKRRMHLDWLERLEKVK